MAIIQQGQPIFPDSQGIQTGVGVTYQDWNVLGQFVTKNIPTLGSDAFANGAVGDGTHDDTAALQQTINQSGVLYLRPGKTFFISSTIIPPNTPNIFIYGGGFISANGVFTMIGLTSATNNNIRIYDTVFLNSAAGTCISIQNNSGVWNEIRGCFFSTVGGGAGIVLSNNGVGWAITDCNFFNSATAISLITMPTVTILGCEFASSITTPIAATGVTNYNVRGCNILDYYYPQIARVQAYQGTANQSLTSGVAAALTFDTHLYALGAAIHSTSTNPTRFTAPVAGFYKAWCQLQVNSAVAAVLTIQVAKNGSVLTTPSMRVVLDQVAGQSKTIQFNGPFQLASGDFLEFQGEQTTGGAVATTLNVTSAALDLVSQP